MKLTMTAGVFALLIVSGSVIGADTLNLTNNQSTEGNSSPSAASIRAQAAANIEKSAQRMEETHKRTMALLAREEALTTRQEQHSDRYEKILDTWERQQVQYQKYLDSLPIK